LACRPFAIFGLIEALCFFGNASIGVNDWAEFNAGAKAFFHRRCEQKRLKRERYWLDKAIAAQEAVIKSCHMEPRT
jgi:hypothetical protein